MEPIRDQFVRMAFNLLVLIFVLAPMGTYVILINLVGFSTVTATMVSMTIILFLMTIFSTWMPSNSAYPLLFFFEFYLLVMGVMVDVPFVNSSVYTVLFTALATHLILLAIWCFVLKSFVVELGLLGRWAGFFLGLRSGFRTVLGGISAFFVDFFTCQWDFPLLRMHIPVPAIPPTTSQDLNLTPVDVSAPPPYIDIIVSSPAPLTSKMNPHPLS